MTHSFSASARSTSATLPLTDETLVQDFLATGNAQSFAQLYHRHFRKVYGQVASYIKDSDIALDLTQDIFLKLYSRLDRYSGRSSFSTWLFRVARNETLDYIRREKRLALDLRDDFRFLHHLSDSDSADEQLIGRCELLGTVIHELSPADRQVLTLMYAYDWQMDEIAEYLGLGLSAVKMRLKRARTRLKSLMEHYESTMAVA